MGSFPGSNFNLAFVSVDSPTRPPWGAIPWKKSHGNLRVGKTSPQKYIDIHQPSPLLLIISSVSVYFNLESSFFISIHTQVCPHLNFQNQQCCSANRKMLFYIPRQGNDIRTVPDNDSKQGFFSSQLKSKFINTDK